ncbi:MAG TPA: NAD+ synthase, partial [bacterium]|nr:NAD+ synthase [bacterium]
MVLRIALAQINTTVGDLSGNGERILLFADKAEKEGCHLVCFPEMSLTGYPPEDLLLKPDFIRENLKMINKLASSIRTISAVVGFVDTGENCLYNAAAFISAGKVCAIYHKMCLPNYGVFDEKRYFRPGTDPVVLNFHHFSIGINICEDIWRIDGPPRIQVSYGASLIINLSASPYHAGKIKEREEIVRRVCLENQVAVAYTNLVGGQDELVFDGQSFLMDNRGCLVGKAAAFSEDILIAEIKSPGIITAPEEQESRLLKEPRRTSSETLTNVDKSPTEAAEIYQALVLGLRDYVQKNRFEKVLIGLSGGVDSALVATLAVDALGPQNVCGVFMPSRFTSVMSREDVCLLAASLSIVLLTIPIDRLFQAYLELLSETFGSKKPDATEENLQARIRGNILMALSNKYGYLVLTTGNKSELSVGYATLYGDMAGGFAVIKDVYKTMVYELARYRNSLDKVIPERILEKEPTAELRANQKDTDTLPPYELLDRILKEYIEQDR